jgi:ABC-type polysaccharide/polyol phosphate transport system ATPase subunit
VRSLCDRGVWLHDGKVRALGSVDEVTEAYAEWMGEGA